MRRMLPGLLAWLAVAAASPGELWALALRNSAAELVVDGLSPGKKRPLQAAAHGPLWVLNTGGERAQLLMTVGRPLAGELLDGYEPVPDPAWVSFNSPRHDLSPGKEGRTTGFVEPSRDAQPGGWYQAQWVSVGTDPLGRELTLRSRLLLRLESGRRPAQSLRAGSPKRADVEFSLLPPRAGPVEVPLGRRVRLKELGAALKLANLGPPARFHLSSESPPKDSPSEKFALAPNPLFMGFESEVVSAGAASVEDAGIWLEIPDQPRYRGRRWSFVVTVTALESEIPRAEQHRFEIVTPKEGAR